jgi:hypothetical protein
MPKCWKRMEKLLSASGPSRRRSVCSASTERHTNPRSNQADFKAMIGRRLSLASLRPTRNAGQTSRQRAQGARRCRSLGSSRTSDARPSRATRPTSPIQYDLAQETSPA